MLFKLKKGEEEGENDNGVEEKERLGIEGVE